MIVEMRFDMELLVLGLLLIQDEKYSKGQKHQ